MKVNTSFKLRIGHLGASSFESFLGNDGKAVVKKIAGGFETEVYTAAGQMLAEQSLIATQRNAFLAAMFFQRVVSRTPMDEKYSLGEKGGEEQYHIPDDDYIRDSWKASYGGKSITVKDLRERCGCEFIHFNDKKEVKKIYKEFLNLLGNRKVATGEQTLRAFRIENTHERFPLLEYGEYQLGSGKIHEGKHFEHGVKGGFSIQAPVGMLRLTQQEFEDTAFNIPTSDLMKDGRLAKWQTGLKKSGSLQSITKVIKGKKKVTLKECAEIARELGL